MSRVTLHSQYFSISIQPYNQLPPYFSSLPSFTNYGLLEAFPSITLISPLIFFASPTCSLFPVQITWSCSVSSTNPCDPGYGKVVFRSVERGSSNPVSRVGLGNAAINVGYTISNRRLPFLSFSERGVSVNFWSLEAIDCQRKKKSFGEPWMRSLKYLAERDGLTSMAESYSWNG